MKKIEHADMRRYTSFQAGGQADALYIAESKEELTRLLRTFHEQGTKFFLLGNGTNTIVRSEGLRIPVVKLGPAFSEIRLETREEAARRGDGLVRMTIGAAALMPQAANLALSEGLAGFEPLSGIPGSVGGALFMNAGAYGTEMKDVVVSAEAVRRDGSGAVVIPVEKMGLSYRCSAFEKDGSVLTSVTIALPEGDPAEIEKNMRIYAAKRSSRQPLKYPSAGSFFKRPEGYYAGALIQDAGLKGLSVGGAEVSELHAGFLINRGGATADDIVHLMRLVQNIVYSRFGVRLEPEVRIIGGEGDETR